MVSNSLFFLTFHSTYSHIIVALYRDQQLLGVQEEDHKKASKNLLLHTSELLDQHALQLSDCAFIATHTGPGPFTTLRVLISSVNGIAYASNIPLIGVDGLIAFIDEYAAEQGATVALLNAFTDDVYYALHLEGKTVSMGCTSLDDCITSLIPTYLNPTQKITFIGNGALLHADFIAQHVQQPYVLPQPFQTTCSYKAIAKKALQVWLATQKGVDQLLPTYLKNYSARMNPPKII
jgi:tRNA threonylcarbamoyladenosine biosynthesis protein TsaB